MTVPPLFPRGKERRSMKTRLVVAAFFAGAFGAANAFTVFDFETEPGTSGGALTSLTMTKDGISLRIVRDSGATFDVFDSSSLPGFFPMSWGTKHLDPFANPATNDWFVGTFSIPLTYVELEMTDFAQDEDTAAMQVYSGPNATGSLLATKSVYWGFNSSPDWVGLGYYAEGNDTIQSIRFRGGSTDFPNSMYVDNIGVVPVPEPATLLAICAGLAALSARRRRK
jgi:hypothetical protein